MPLECLFAASFKGTFGTATRSAHSAAALPIALPHSCGRSKRNNHAHSCASKLENACIQPSDPSQFAPSLSIIRTAARLQLL